MAIRLTLLFVSGCGLAPLPHGATSYGLPNDGVLLRGVALPSRGLGFVRAKDFDETRWGTRDLVDLIDRAASEVSRAFPGAAPLYVGDLSALGGGAHALHGSHRTGRDADVLFYMTDSRGESVRGSGFFAFDARGVSARAASVAGGPTGLAYFDAARNWAFVRALLRDAAVRVQWIFCSDGIKARLLSWAAAHERDPSVLIRASYVLHQPSHGRVHDDHFHLRIACSARARAEGCADVGPVWPWERNDHEKPEWEGVGYDDDTLVRALLEGLTVSR